MCSSDLSPVRFRGFVLPLICELSQLIFTATADGLQYGAMLQSRKEVVDSLVSIGMSTAHEAIPNDTDIQRF